MVNDYTFSGYNISNVLKRYRYPISCVYMISIGKYIYIGSTYIFSKRKFEHLWNLKNKIHTNGFLQNLYNKYGEEKFIFSILEECEMNMNSLINCEQKYIDKYRNDKNYTMVNLSPIAGTTLGVKQSKETCEKKRKSMIGKNKGKIRTKEQCESQSKRQKGRIISEEHKMKISNKLKGKINTNKPKKFINYDNTIYSYKDFAILVGLNKNTIYTCVKKKFEIKYNCKFLL